MIPVLPWTNLRARVRAVSQPGDTHLTRVALRLAGQTVTLLLVMLIVLEVAVFIITQQAFLGSLKATLNDRTRPPLDLTCSLYHLPCASGSAYDSDRDRHPGPPFGSPFGPGGRGGSSSINPDLTPSDATSIFVTRTLSVVHVDGALGAVLLAPEDARAAIRHDEVQCCSVHPYKGENYLVYTRPLAVSGHGVVGAVQASISEHQYQATMSSLLQALIVVALLGLLGSAAISAALVRRALQPIRQAMQRQRDFVADAAHELRTPLAIQRAVGEVAAGEATVEDLEGAVSQMLIENQHLTRLVEDLSLLARSDSNAVTVNRAPVDVSSLVEATSDELSYLAEDQGVSLRAEITPGITVTGDIVRLRQLLLILLDNSFKHTPEGGTVDVRLLREQGRMRLEVTDSGPGIKAEDLSRIFDRFYRADQARTGQGTGLGLAIARWIVEAHGGHISAANVSPHGAAFTVTLPIS